MKIYRETAPALVLFCLLILVAPALASPAPKRVAQQPANAHPSIQLHHPDYNFGTAVQGATVQHAFTVSNTGKKTLKIEHVKVA